MRSIVGFGSIAVLVVACGDSAGSGGSGGSGGSEGGAGGASTSGVTFHKDVEPILQASCLGCHYEGRIGGFSLETYEQAAPLASMIAAVTASGQMPPWHAKTTDECQPRFEYRDNPSLSAETIATLQAWADAEAPRGNPADAPPAFKPAELGLPNSDLDIEAPVATTVEGDSDQFVCLIHDPKLDQKRYLDGMNIVPGNEKVAHHALMFRLSRADALELSGGGDSFPCFGAPPGDLVQAWAPGAQPLQLPQNVGLAMDADDVIVVQMHYHPTGVGPEQDRSTIQMRFMDSKPAYTFEMALVGNANNAPELLAGPNDAGGPEFKVPAGATNHTEAMEFTVPDLPIRIPILVVGTHMHYVGVGARFSIERKAPGDEPKDECFVETPRWDFNWQRGYMYDAAISDLPTLGSGDTLRMDCNYDNSMSNPLLAKALASEGMSAPQEVRLGEETLDEMCLGVLGILVPNVGN
jgi:hypothetical protein